jgi:5-oxoprolinase (ATP-hydrolysing) subunit C
MSRVSGGLIEILQPGIGTTIQDRGRLGHRHEGIPTAGWLDAPLAEAANALVGNAGGQAVLEVRGMGTQLRIKQGVVRVALAGRIGAKWQRHEGTAVALPAWQTATLHNGDQLMLGAAETGCAYLAVAGGLKLPAQLGSCSSYGRAGLQGLLGRAWLPGDVLPCSGWVSKDFREWRIQEWSMSSGPIRVLPGPQQKHFSEQALALFFSEVWQATPEQDRMGLRLRGPMLRHASTQDSDIVSDAVAPGAIQVPANGQPIVLMADSQTVGGYPKIAHVISADLSRLAHLKPGTQFKFECVTPTQARHALAAQRESWLAWLATRESFLPPGFIDEEALYNNNLVSGVLLARI